VEPFSIGIISMVVLVILVLLNMPVGFVMALVGFVGVIFISGWDVALSVATLSPFRHASNYLYSIFPLFIVMGWLASAGGLSTDAFTVLNRWIGRVRGGLAMATTWTCTAFGAVCGDAIVTAATMVPMALPAMREHKYSEEMSTGVIAAGGGIGFLIPPSLAFIIYGIITETSIGLLFIAGVFPGILCSILYCLAIYIACRRNPKAGPPGVSFPFREMIKVPPGGVAMIVLIVVVIGGIYGGWFTPTEAGAIGAAGALVLAIALRRLNRNNFRNTLSEAGRATGMFAMLIIGIMIFSNMVALSGVPHKIVEFVTVMNLPPMVVLVGILIFFIVLGLFLEIFSMIMVFIPVFNPLLVAMGFDPIWMGVLVVVTILIGQISPPVGIVVYAMSGIIRDVPVWTIFKGVIPFLVATIIALVILVAVPQISLFLPGLMLR
jgi:C4-dicarboxylate transporter DctM subunit